MTRAIESTRQTQPRLLDIPEVCELLGVGRSCLYAMLDRGDFPQGVRVGRRMRRWSQECVDEWLATREQR